MERKRDQLSANYREFRTWKGGGKEGEGEELNEAPFFPSIYAKRRFVFSR